MLAREAEGVAVNLSPIQSTKEAMAVLKAQRQHLIELARLQAIRIVLARGTVHTREVRQAMLLAGELPSYQQSECWLGAVFHSFELFEWTGDWHYYKDEPGRNIHSKHIKIWRLR